METMITAARRGNDMMKLEHQQGAQYILYFFGTFMFIASIVLVFQSLEQKQDVTNWKMTVAGSEERYPTGQAIDIQLFLEDEMGMAIEDANIVLTMDRPGTVHNLEKVMHHVESGLYESEVIFSLPGTWIGMVEVTNGKKRYQNQFLLQVDGQVISAQNRDPADAFHLNQPLPNEIKRQLN